MLKNIILRHDEIANLLGVAAEPFIGQHKAQVTEMQQSILCYMKLLQDILSTDTGERPAPGLGLAHGIGSHETESAPGTHLRLNKAGFPELLPSFSPQKCTKRGLEILMRQYLSHHHCKFVYHW